MSNVKENSDSVRESVRTHYAQAALTVLEGKGAACCGPSGNNCGAKDPITADAYRSDEVEGIPEDAVSASLGCANPTALAELKDGETVLDLGSGGGIDVLLSAKRVGPSGFAYGLDMTDEMLELAHRNLKVSGLKNVKFLKGNIEEIPLPDSSVDVVISNCVINLSTDKDRVLREAFRVLNPGGRFAVADVVAEKELPEEVKRDVEAYAGCIAGALTLEDYRSKLWLAGFTEIAIQPVRSFSLGDLGASCCGGSDESSSDGPLLHSAFIRATKPAKEN